MIWLPIIAPDKILQVLFGFSLNPTPPSHLIIQPFYEHIPSDSFSHTTPFPLLAIVFYCISARLWAPLPSFRAFFRHS